MQHGQGFSFLKSWLSKTWSGLALICFLVSGAVHAQPLFGNDPGPQQIARETVSQLKASSTEGHFSVTLFNQDKLIDLKADRTPVQDLLMRNYSCDPYREAFYFTSTFTKYIAPSLVIADLIKEMVAQNYTVACSVDAGPALGHQEVIEDLAHLQNLVTQLRCLYKLEP